jgi:[histone H3]-lysine9 N-trimethyltransferase SUV39H
MVECARSCQTRAAEELIREEMHLRLQHLSGCQVRLLNLVDRSSPPLRFRFIEYSFLGQGVTQLPTETMVGCLQCRPDMGQNIGCEYTRKCDCLEYAAVDENRLTVEQRAIFDNIKSQGSGDTSSLPKRFPYFSTGPRKGCLVPLYLESRNAIYECNANCRCGPRCKTRNVQKGRQVQLEIFKTKKRGWGKISISERRIH